MCLSALLFFPRESRLAGSAPSGLGEASSFKLSLGEQRDHGSTEDEAALLAKYSDDCCKGCGYHPAYGCASSCPLLPRRAEDGADQMSDDENQACSDSEFGDLARPTNHYEYPPVQQSIQNINNATKYKV